MVLLTSSMHWGPFAAKFDLVRLRVSTSKFEAVVDCFFQVGSVLLPQVRKLKKKKFCLLYSWDEQAVMKQQ